MLDKKFIMTLCFLGYFWHRALMACTTTTWRKRGIRGRFRTTENSLIQKEKRGCEVMSLILDVKILLAIEGQRKACVRIK